MEFQETAWNKEKRKKEMRPSKKIMTEKKIANLIQVKSVLLNKYLRLVKVAKSQTKRQAFLHKADKHRKSIEQLNVMK